VERGVYRWLVMIKGLGWRVAGFVDEVNDYTLAGECDFGLAVGSGPCEIGFGFGVRGLGLTCIVYSSMIVLQFTVHGFRVSFERLATAAVY